MKAHRGIVDTTLTSYGNYVGDLVRVLGDDPQTYTCLFSKLIRGLD
jgi:hypothetical protein